MEAIAGYFFGVLAVILAFGFIIFIHELGHFLTARAVDIRCPQFAIGFGPQLFGFRWRGTNFAVRALPLGGYVLMNGEEPGDRSEDPWADSVRRYLGEHQFPAAPSELLSTLEKIPESERGQDWIDVRDQVAYARSKTFPDLQSVEGNFHDRSVWARILVISGGVIMNFISTILILWVLGPMVGLGGVYRQWAPVISQTYADTPAREAGITSRDSIQTVGGKPTATFLEAYHEIGKYPGVPLEMTLLDGEGKTKDVSLTPLVAIGDDTFKVGPEGVLTLTRSTEHKDLAGTKVTSVDREGLLALTKELSGQKEPTYELTLEGKSEPLTFKAEQYPEFSGPRGQIGVAFGIADISFEDKLHGRIASVEQGAPGAGFGFQKGDKLLQIGGLNLMSNNGYLFGSRADSAFEEVAKVRDSVEEVEVVLIRDDAAETIQLPNRETPYTLDELGLTLEPVTTGDLIKAPFEMIGQTMAIPFRIAGAYFSSQMSGKEIVENLQGPIGIMQLIYGMSDNGIAQFLFFVALLNAAIGAFNLMPIPALDGSRLVFLLIAAVRGKAVDPDKEAKIHLAGLMVLLSFVLLVSFGDIKRLLSDQVFVM